MVYNYANNIMKKHYFSIPLITLVFVMMIIVFSGCKHNDDEDNPNNQYSNEEIPENPSQMELEGTKWVLSDWDYSVGDDYIGIHDETYVYFFYSKDEGSFYYGKKDDYSDMNASTNRVICYFKYSVSGNTISLDYITDYMLSDMYLDVYENTLTASNLEFSKSTITTSDYQWLNTVRGITGNCSWYNDLRNKLWIIGDGAMSDYSSYNSTPWAINKRNVNEVVVCDGVTKIGSYAFANQSITVVDMPDSSLKEIGKAAFKNSSIDYIWISQSCTTIGEDAFANCRYLGDVIIPRDIVWVEDGAFSGCTNLSVYRMNFGKDLRRIGKYAFEGASAFQITFEEGVQNIDNGAFLGTYCKDKELILPNSIETLGATVFSGPFNKIVIGSGVTSIGGKTFISSANSGEMYVNCTTPPMVNSDIIVESQNWNSAESRWTLYVPKGCKQIYANKYPWNKFKSIIENGDNNDNNGTINGHEYVDLGLPSGLKWATCNIGASSPEDYGDYYAWGETETKDYYSADNCSTYNVQTNDISGNIKYDAARANWGGSWRMPTKTEMEELIDFCKWEWAQVDGVVGNKVIGVNGNSIFIPAAGCRVESWLADAGGYGCYWSSTPDESYIYGAHRLYFNDGDQGVSWDDRCEGRSVRPVTE